MSYFSPLFLLFFKDLAKNNHKTWFDDNRKMYEKEVKKPFADFVGEMILRIQEHEPEVRIKASDAIFRINRDIRFSKDKSPYKTHAAAVISRYGRKNKSRPGFYFQLSHEGAAVYGGMYRVEKNILQNIRRYIAANTKAFAAVHSDKAFTSTFGKIQGERHKRIPKEFQAAAEVEPLIANKQFYYGAEFGPDIITSDSLADKLMAYYLAGKNVHDFLRKAIGK